MIYASSATEVLERRQPAHVLSGGIGDFIKCMYHGMPDEATIWLVSMEGYIDEASWKVRLNAAIEILSADDRVRDIIVFRRGGDFEAPRYGDLVLFIHALAKKNNLAVQMPPVSRSEFIMDYDPSTAKIVLDAGRPMVTILPHSGGARRGNAEFLRRISTVALDDGYGIIYVGDRRFPNGDMNSLNTVIDEMVLRGAIDLTRSPTMRSTWTAAKLSRFRISDHTMGLSLFSLVPSDSILLSRMNGDIDAMKYYVLNYDEGRNLYIFEALQNGNGLEGIALADYVIEWMRTRI